MKAKTVRENAMQGNPMAESHWRGSEVHSTLIKPNGSPGFGNTELFAQGGAYLVRQEVEDDREL